MMEFCKQVLFSSIFEDVFNGIQYETHFATTIISQDIHN